MSVAEGTRETLAAKFGAIFPHLDERQRRLLMGAEARSWGIRVVALAAGVREATVSLGVGELDSGAAPLGRARKPGGGRKRLADLDPGLRPALLALVEPAERGDPMSPLRWTTKSLRVLASVSLTEPGPSGRAEPARLLPRLSCPPRRPPAQAAPSFTSPLRRRGDGRSGAHEPQAHDR